MPGRSIETFRWCLNHALGSDRLYWLCCPLTMAHAGHDLIDPALMAWRVCGSQKETASPAMFMADSGEDGQLQWLSESDVAGDSQRTCLAACGSSLAMRGREDLVSRRHRLESRKFGLRPLNRDGKARVHQLLISQQMLTTPLPFPFPFSNNARTFLPRPECLLSL